MNRNSSKINRAALDAQYTSAAFIENSGIPCETLEKELLRIGSTEEPLPSRRARMIAYTLENARVEIHPFCPFGGRLEERGLLIREARRLRTEAEKQAVRSSEALQCARARLFTGSADYSHLCPEWDRILALGIPGLLADLRARRTDETLTGEQMRFLDACITVYRAILSYIRRLAGEARVLSRGDDFPALMAAGLESLAEGAPRTTYEALELIWMIYYLQTHLDYSQVRSLGALDAQLYPFWQADLASGRFTEQQLDELLRCFMLTIRAFGHANNIPFCLCGSSADGSAKYNSLSLHILEIYDALNIHDPKIQLRWNRGLPREIVEKTLDMIRRGNNSIVIMNDPVVIDSLVKLGISREHAAAYAPVGCYEPNALHELGRTTAGRVNLAKAAELAVTDGMDALLNCQLLPPAGAADDYAAFEERFFTCLAHGVRLSMDRIQALERFGGDVHASLIFSPTLSCCVERAKDAYLGGALYENSSICAFGLATAVDSLIAVKHLVYDERAVSLGELAEILKNNWEGHEELRRRCMQYPKYGNGDEECDALTARITARAAGMINGVPNARGGVFRMGMFSINWYTEFGAHTGATPDGRFSGDPISKNMSPAIARDRSGVTDLIRSATALDYTSVPNGTALDLLLHASAVQGEDGLTAMMGLLGTFMRRGGMALQINVLSPEELRRAQADPAAYANLQVRLCGWNVHFVDLSRDVQDEFIRISENAGA